MPVIHTVDDDVAVTCSVSVLLESLGYEVCVWNDSRAFVAQAPLHLRYCVTGYAHAAF